MRTHKIALTVMAVLSGSMAFSNTPLLEDTTFSAWPAMEGTKWRAGTNHFMNPFAWRFWDEAVDGYYTYESRIQPSEDGFLFYSYDDYEAAISGEDDRFLINGQFVPSDKLYNSLFQEYNAGPTISFFPGIFKEGDVIVFKGMAKANIVADANGDMEMKAFIKVLGWVGGIDFQEREWTQKVDIPTTLQPFEIRVTMPDSNDLEPQLQVVQIGFEINNFWDGNAQVMDEGTIFFKNIEAYIEGVDWNCYAVNETGWADTGSWMGMVNVAADPWIWVHSIEQYVYIPADGISAAGAWSYVSQ